MRRKRKINFKRLFIVISILVMIAGGVGYIAIPKLFDYLHKQELIRNDKTAPGASVQTATINKNGNIEVSDIVYDIYDNVSDADDIDVKLKKTYTFDEQGVFQVVVVLTDEAGNSSEIVGNVKVLNDVISPVLSAEKYSFLIPAEFGTPNEEPITSITPIGLPTIDTMPTKWQFCQGKENRDIEYQYLNQEENIELKAYHFYGESLNLYGNEYIANDTAKDSFVSATFVLRNICTQEEFSYSYSEFIDNNIKVYQLTPGTYEIYVKQGNSEKRLISNSLIYDTMYTITRNQKNKKVQIYANKEIAKDILTENQVFLSVQEIDHKDLPSGVYDVVVDPGHYSMNYIENMKWYSIDMGASNGDYNEGNANYLTATELKSYLESKGLKVKMTREYSEEVILEYGINSRIHTPYLYDAKFYFACHLNTHPNTAVSGSEVYTTRFGTMKLADTISKSLMESNIPVHNSSLQLKSGIFDYYHFIRETGGYATMASYNTNTYSGTNAISFARTTHGSQGLLLEFAFISNPSELQKWKTSYQLSAQKAGEGILNYLEIE